MRKWAIITTFLLAGCIPAGDSQEFGGVKDNGDAQHTSDLSDLSEMADGDTTTDMELTPDMTAPDMTTPDMPTTCVPVSSEAFCDSFSAECDSKTGLDNCQVERTVDCGVCPNIGDTCVNNRCACVSEGPAEFCERLGATCDLITAPDNCGRDRTLNCGVCFNGAVCRANICEEVNCTNSADDDRDMLEDCADSDCLDARCGIGGLKCQADGSCQ